MVNIQANPDIAQLHAGNLVFIPSNTRKHTTTTKQITQHTPI